MFLTRGNALYALVLMLMLTAAGCAQKSLDKETQPHKENVRPPVTKSDNLVDKSVGKEPIKTSDDWGQLPNGRHFSLTLGLKGEWVSTPITHTPPFFLSQGWIDSQTIWGQSGNKVVFVETDKPEYRDAGFNSWLAVPSPDGQAMAWTDQEGLWTGRPGKQTRLLLKAGAISDVGMVPPAQVLWSPDGKQLLAGWEQEWDTAYALIDASTGKAKRLETKIEGYFLTTDTVWLDNHRILFSTRASTSLNGENEYGTGYRGDLAELDTLTNNYRLVTGVKDGVFLSVSGRMGNEVLIGEGPKGAAPSKYHIFETSNWSSYQADIPAGRAYPSPLGNRAIVITGSSYDGMNTVYRLSLWQADGSTKPFALVRAEDSLNISWSPNGLKVAVSHTISEPNDEGPSGSLRTKYLTEVFSAGPGSGLN